jgi:hypothetical protein
MISLAIGGNPSIVNYDMFVGVFSMLTLFYHIATSVNESFEVHPALSLALDVLNLLFFLCAGIATAAYLHVGNCMDRVSSYIILHLNMH